MTPRRRAVAFLAVGLLGFLWQIAALDAMVRHAAVSYPLAVALAVELAIVHNFLWHERWTWRERRTSGPGARLARLGRFNGASALTSVAGNVFLTVVLVESLRVPVVPANVAAVALLSALNFVLADRFVFRATLAALLAAMAAVPASAAGPAPETVAAFDAYVRATEQRLSREAADPGRFLWIDFQAPADAASLRARLRQGEIVALAAKTDGARHEVPAGLVHHWRGYVFIPDATVDELLAALRAPEAHRQSEVLEARVSEQQPGRHRLFLKLRRDGIVTAVYNTEHLVTYARDTHGRAISRSLSRRIAEVERRDDGREREKPEGDDRGFLWRMNSYWRYEPVSGGVIVELESITLSRDLPWGLGAVARPVISRVARESVTRTLASLRDRFTGPSPPLPRRAASP